MPDDEVAAVTEAIPQNLILQTKKVKIQILSGDHSYD
jgi:hypothetical protein